MSRDPVEFQIEEAQFKVQPLKLKDAMRGWAILANVLLPAAFGLDQQGPAAIAGALSGLERLPELFDMFAPRTQVKFGAVPSFAPLATFAEDVFARRSDLLLAYLVECVVTEFGPLLDARGRSVLQQTGSRFGSLLALTGQSTASPSTPE